MALINCSECGKQISDKATSCPACGAPVKQNQAQRPPAWEVTNGPKPQNSKLGVLGMILSFIYCIPIAPLVGLALCIASLTEKDRKKKNCAIIGTAFGGFYVLILIIALSSGTITNDAESSTSKTDVSTVASVEPTEAPTPEPTEVPIEYIQCTVDELMDTLESNALKAEKTYQDQYIEVTGRLAVIDSDGKYISLHPINNEWAFQGIQCYIENEEQLNHVLDLNVDDTVTVRVQCKSIGEVLGYSADIIEFVK